MFPAKPLVSSCRGPSGLIDVGARRVAADAAELSSVRMTIRRSVVEGEGALEVDIPRDDWLAGTSPYGHVRGSAISQGTT